MKLIALASKIPPEVEDAIRDRILCLLGQPVYSDTDGLWHKPIELPPYTIIHKKGNVYEVEVEYPPPQELIITLTIE
jgi:hypothetical protein